MATSASVTSARDTDDRLSRDQTSHASQELERQWDDWAPAPYTMAPPALEGFEQRWVRVRMGGQEDLQNYLKRIKQGWKPRPASTLPQAYIGLKVKLDKERYGDQGDLIGNQDCVLMHRPIRIGEQVRARLREQNNRLSASIREFVRGNLPAQHGTAGGVVEELSMTTITGNGRKPKFGD